MDDHRDDHRDHVGNFKLAQGDKFTWVDMFINSFGGSAWLSMEISGVEFSNIFLDDGQITTVGIHGRKDIPFTILVCETISNEGSIEQAVTMKLVRDNGFVAIDED